MAAVVRKIHRSRVRNLCRNSALTAMVSALPLLAILCACETAKAQDSQASAPRTTLVIFADHSIQDAQWTDLIAALRTGVTDGGAETQSIMGTPEILRGDSLHLGVLVQTVVVVYLHGDCNLEPLLRRTVYGLPLGWTRRTHGRIEPFAHVDCSRIGQVLGPQALGMKREQRMDAMDGAIARVILHEWIHIATQNPNHAGSGIAKAEFGVADLLAGGR